MPIFVLTCMKFAHLLGEFAERVQKYWGEPFFVYVSHTDLQHWSDGTLNFLRNIPYEYLILLHEDFYLTRPVNKDLVTQLKKLAIEKKADRVSLLGNHTPERTYELESGIFAYKGEAEYHFSLEASIQRREYLLNNLKGNQNPWDAENSRRDRGKGLILCSQDPAIWYQDRLRRGKYEEVL